MRLLVSGLPLKRVRLQLICLHYSLKFDVFVITFWASPHLSLASCFLEGGTLGVLTGALSLKLQHPPLGHVLE